jgi:DNA-binding response OmpR family regulator
LVDDEPQVIKVLGECLTGPHIELLKAANLAEARLLLAKGPIDLALVEPNLSDGSGMVLAGEIRRRRPATQTIVITGQPSLERAVEAIRAGAADFIIKPLDLGELNDRVRLALANRRNDRRRQARIQRLRRVCKKLNQARHEVAQQVDILCNDLVTAYQDLASQMQSAVQTSEYAGLVRNELDLESLLRRTLEYLLQKAGPTNAAIFLPATADEYTLGGYVNYDCTAESADMLLEHLADVVAPRLAQREGPLLITDNATLTSWIGDDAAYLADSHVLAFSCRRGTEPLAVIALFRDHSQPFPAEMVEICAGIAPMLADYLSRIIRVHHRLAPGAENA